MKSITADTGRRPTSFRLQSEITTGSDLQLSDDAAGWTFEAVAQFYQSVNDRLMWFFPKSGAKTINERVASGRVKIHDGHPYELSLSETLGRVLSAVEAPRQMRYTGFISRAHEEAAQKLADGTIDENSMELFLLRTTPHEVDLEAVPEHVRPWVELSPDGMAVVTGVLEYRWDAIGLVSSSSQGRQAIFEPPVLVEYQDLAVTNSSWSPEKAQESLSVWQSARTHGEAPRLAQQAFLARFRQGDGTEVLAGQIAQMDDSGQLIVVRDALEPALAELRSKLSETRLSEVAKKAVMDAAYLRAGKYLGKSGSLTEQGSRGRGSRDDNGSTPATPDALSATSDGAGPPKEQEVSADAASQTAAGPAHAPPTVGSDQNAAARAAKIAHLSRRAKIEALKAHIHEVLT